MSLRAAILERLARYKRIADGTMWRGPADLRIEELKWVLKLIDQAEENKHDFGSGGRDERR